MSTPLPPCPFCGADARPVELGGGTWQITCSECHASTGLCGTEAHAVARWAARFEAEALRARIADLERQLAAAITHPLAVEMVTRLRTACTAGSCGPSPSLDELAATAIEAWRDDGCPFRVGDVANVG